MILLMHNRLPFKNNNNINVINLILMNKRIVNFHDFVAIK